MLLIKNTAAGIYTFEINYLPSIAKDTISTKYGLVGSIKVSYIIIGNAKKYDAIIKKKLIEGYKTLQQLGITLYQLESGDKSIIDKLPRFTTDTNDFVKICKCQKFVAGKFNYDPFAVGQPKINGNRVTINWGIIGDGLFKKEGVVIKSHEGHTLTINHIAILFESIYEKCSKDIIFDGEMYVRGEPVTSISGACRNVNNAIHKKLRYHCFDLAISNVDQNSRLVLKTEILSSHNYPGLVYKQKTPADHSSGILDTHMIIDVCNYIIYNDEDAAKFRDECIEAGYEGAVIRDISATYPFGSRSKNLMKLKKAHYGKFEVVDINTFGFDNTDNNIGKGINFVLRNDITKDLFESKPLGLDVDQQMDLYTNRKKVIGTKAVVRYYERSTNNIPFHTNVIVHEGTE